jgi:hypothetical protein
MSATLRSWAWSISRYIFPARDKIPPHYWSLETNNASAPLGQTKLHRIAQFLNKQYTFLYCKITKKSEILIRFGQNGHCRTNLRFSVFPSEPIVKCMLTWLTNRKDFWANVCFDIAVVTGICFLRIDQIDQKINATIDINQKRPFWTLSRTLDPADARPPRYHTAMVSYESWWLPTVHTYTVLGYYPS